ncbi:hypothetical protein [Parasphingopyxis sp.]|uniref:hypothetical protein n=1 Tax=Parasphingopyxis sp. TaxID=1920299 RepID=UPI00263999DD|nr:hypothetical protein [Parasphingopyxis sp.]
MPGEWVKDIDALHDFVSYVVLCAPDEFPVEDFLEDHEQMNLEKAFEELRHGILLLHPEVGTPQKVPIMHSKLDEAYKAYKAGDGDKGAHLVQDFRNMIFKRED